MGSCLSSVEMAYQSSTAKVITINGALIEYSSATMVSDVLHSNDSTTGAFICSSDELHFDAYIPVLSHTAWLELDQIYFMLPMSMLHRPLSAQGMSALAVKASLALDNTSSRAGKRVVQVVPMPELDDHTFSTTVRPTHSHRAKKNSGKRAPLRGRRTIPSWLSAIEE